MGYTSQFGVQNTGGGSGMVQPKLKYKFKVIFDFGGPLGNGADATVLTRDVITISRPTLAFGEGVVHSYNSIAYYAQKPEWSTIEASFRDGIDNKVTKAIQAQLKRQMDHAEQASSQAGSDYKFTTIIEMLDGGQTSLPYEKWVLEGCFFTNVNYQSLDYAASDAMTVDVTMRYDIATLEDGVASDKFMTGTGS